MSGSDLYIDGEMLARVRQNLRHITDILEDPMEKIREVGAEDAGVDELSDRLGEFGEEWDYGIGKINEYAGGAADTLQNVEQAFDDLDLSLAQALQDARSGSGSGS
ncbi:hypothetical protein ACTWP5_23520 [Streptomyces sp. 4N509B]|uniref:hypothetical protein n=1 Tax=Streptomyces sp. 4N509B TaxID=3457413 RepID=UPI003FD05A57